MVTELLLLGVKSGYGRRRQRRRLEFRLEVESSPTCRLVRVENKFPGVGTVEFVGSLLLCPVQEPCQRQTKPQTRHGTAVDP
jgi:hypothetical protein